MVKIIQETAQKGAEIVKLETDTKDYILYFEKIFQELAQKDAEMGKLKAEMKALGMTAKEVVQATEMAKEAENIALLQHYIIDTISGAGPEGR